MVDTLRGKALRAGARVYGQIMVKATKRNFVKGARWTGTLQKNITYKIVTMKKKRMVMVIIGARKKMSVETKWGKRVPSRYFHLYEKGHNKGPKGRFPLKRAYQTHRASAKNAAAQEIIKVMEREAFKRMGKGKKVFR